MPNNLHNMKKIESEPELLRSESALEIAPKQNHQQLTRPQQFDIESVFRYAIEHQGTADTLEKLMSIRRELNAEQSQKAFDEALSAFQAECPVIIKEKGVPDRSGKTAYKFAPVESIEVQIRPYLRKHGFSHTFDTDIASEVNWVIAKCIVTHCEGHKRISTAKFPLGTKTQIMSDTQVYAAALTFANRRALCNAYGLVLSGEDIDGQTGKLKPQGPSTLQPTEPNLKALASELWKVLAPVRGPERNWKQAEQFCWDEALISDTEKLPDLTAARFKEVIAKAKERLAKTT